MRSTILLCVLIITESIKYNSITDKNILNFIAIFFIIAVLMDIIDFIKNIIRK